LAAIKEVLGDAATDEIMEAWKEAYFFASSEESVGKHWFREGAEIVIECGFIGFLGAETVRFSGDQF
jgi:hypothetical protein